MQRGPLITDYLQTNNDFYYVKLLGKSATERDCGRQSGLYARTGLATGHQRGGNGET